LSPQIAGFRWRRELIVPLAVGVCLSGGSECVHRSFEVALVLVSVDSERRGQVAVPESLRGGFDARNPTEVGCERVTRPVHVEAGANAVADEAGLFEHSVPPAMHGVGCASVLRVGPVDAPIGVPLLGVEEVVVGLGLPSDEIERSPR